MSGKYCRIPILLCGFSVQGLSVQELTCVVIEFIFDVPEITCGDKRVSDPNMFSFGKKNLTDGLTCFTCDVNAC